MNAAFFVQTVKGRETVLADSLASIEVSDIVEYTLATHDPEEMPVQAFFFSLLERMAKAETELVVRLEDDIIVNKYIRHNVENWPALDDPEFGAGWLFVMRSVTGPSWFHSHRMMPSGEMWRSHLPIHGGVGYVFKTKDMPALIEALQPFKDHGDLMDVGVSSAIDRMARRLYLHMPSLLEHRLDVASSMNHHHSIENSTAGGLFEPDWRRGG